MASAQVRDVAAHAGVSPATVSNALNHPEKVSEATRRRVQAAIDELGYVRHDAARQLRRRHNSAVGMIVPDVADPFFAEVVRGAEDSVGALRRPMLVGGSGRDPERELARLHLVEEQRVSGLIIAPVGEVLPRLRELSARGTAVVLVAPDAEDAEFSAVSIDDELGGRLAVEHLLAQGRRRPAMIGGPPDLRQVARRRAGAEAACAAHAGVDLRMVDTGALGAEAGRSGARRLLELPADQRPDAIVAADDLVACGALQELLRAGVQVPADVALIGCEDGAVSASAAVPISSVRRPALETGERAAALLLAAIDDPASAREQLHLAPALVARESTLGG